jgi:hypothetical protein
MIGFRAQTEYKSPGTVSALQCRLEGRQMRIATIALAAVLLSTGLGNAQAAPAQRGNAPAAAATDSTTQFKTEADAKSHCQSGDVVWMNLGSHVYHMSGTKDYGHTKRGAYMCQADADKIGHAAKDQKPKKSS